MIRGDDPAHDRDAQRDERDRACRALVEGEPSGDADAARARWNMPYIDGWDELPGWQKRAWTAREYLTDVLGIDPHDG